MRALMRGTLALLGIAVPAAAEGPGSILQATDCELGSFRVVAEAREFANPIAVIGGPPPASSTFTTPRIISTWQFMPQFDPAQPDGMSPDLAGFAVIHQVNIRSQMNAIAANFPSSEVWRQIDASGDCEKRFHDPGATAATTTGNDFQITITFRMEFVTCDKPFDGMRIPNGGGYGTVVVSALPILKWGKTTIDGDGVTVREQPDLKFKVSLVSTRFETSGQQAFLQNTIGRVFGAPSTGDVANGINETASAMLVGMRETSLDRIGAKNVDFQKAIEGLAQASAGSPLANVSPKLRRAFFESMKPQLARWAPDYTRPADLTLSFEPDLMTATGPKFPFVQKKSVMCPLAHATAAYFLDRPNDYTIVDVMTRNGPITDPATIRRILR